MSLKKHLQTTHSVLYYTLDFVRATELRRVPRCVRCTRARVKTRIITLHAAI